MSPRVLVLRAHSLGDVVLATSVLSALARRGSPRVAGTPLIEAATEARYLPVFRGHPAVDRLWSVEELRRRVFGGEVSPDGSVNPDDLVDLDGSVEPDGARDPHGRHNPGVPIDPVDSLRHDAARFDAMQFDHVLDLQGTFGSRALAARLGPSSRVRTRAAARRWVVFWGDRFPRPRVPHAVIRYLEAIRATASKDDDLDRPLCVPTEQDERLAREAAPEAYEIPAGRAVALLTGASRRSKEYPADQFAELSRLLRAEGIPVWWIAPPARDRVVPAGLSDAGLRDTGSTVLQLPLAPLKAVLARAALAVSSDSGPMHLASALGVPVLSLFGSSVPAFGFTPTGPLDRVLSVDGLSCRPCGVHGRDRCWLGHWRCLRDLEPRRVAREAMEMLASGIVPRQPVSVPKGNLS